MTNDLRLIHTQGLDEEIRCAMCTNTMKSDRGCDGGCVVDQKMYEKILKVIESNLLISRDVTNGDVIKAVFPDSVIDEDDFIALTNLDDVTSFRGDWWNAPYREGGSE